MLFFQLTIDAKVSHLNLQYLHSIHLNILVMRCYKLCFLQRNSISTQREARNVEGEGNHSTSVISRLGLVGGGGALVRFNVVGGVGVFVVIVVGKRWMC